MRKLKERTCSSKFKNCTYDVGINSSNPVVINDQRTQPVKIWYVLQFDNLMVR